MIFRSGPQSLHHLWKRDDKANFDVYASPYTEIPNDGSRTEGLTIGEIIPGAKWSGLATLLGKWDGWRDYDHIMLADDDLLLGQADASKLFASCHSLGCKLAQPSLTAESPSTHLIVYKNKSFTHRATSFVEIMAPIFRCDVLSELLWTLSLSETGWGWGLDHLWPFLLGYEGVYIHDQISMVHALPVGRSRDRQLERKVHYEAHNMFKKFNFRPHYATLGGHDGRTDIDFSNPSLLHLLIKGYDSIFDDRPSLLYGLIREQVSWQARLERSSAQVNATPDGSGQTD